MAKKAEWPLKERVEVEWVDAATTGGWREKRFYAAREPKLVRTMGYVARRDRKAVVLVQSMGKNEDRYEGDMSDSMVVPAECVRRIRRLKER